MNLLLIGPRGCGKSTLGRRVAAELELAFVDLDERVLSRFEETSVAAIWAAHGEAAWRRAEVDMLETALADDRQLIALGGGVPMLDEARRRIEIAQRGRKAAIAYLRCSVDELTRRLHADVGDRPGLTGTDPVAEIATVLERREPAYRSLADRVIEVGGLTVDEAAAALVAWAKEALAGREG